MGKTAEENMANPSTDSTICSPNSASAPELTATTPIISAAFLHTNSMSTSASNSMPSMNIHNNNNNTASQQQQQQQKTSPPGSMVPNANRPAPQQSGRMALCILSACSNSHPFEERRIPVARNEDEAVKIGRSVVRLQPTPNNAIFDCKVLSRNHAILWSNGNGQFLIKDTRSSNGTFINNERLSASGEESEPRELFSGDILQLGVEIVDNAKKVASGCVTCIVRLINERGEECAGRPQTDRATCTLLQQQVPQNCTLVRNDKLFMMDQYIKEAKHRENLLGQKLQTLEEQLRVAQEALQSKWQEQVNQELMLSRIELLQSQLDQQPTKKAGSKGNTSNTTNEDAERLALALADRGRTEQLAKEQLRANQEQMQETAMRLHDAEMGLHNVEEECEFLRQRCSDFEAQLGRQREDYDALLDKYNEVYAQLSAAEKASTALNLSNNEMEQAKQQNMNGDGESGNTSGAAASMNDGGLEQAPSPPPPITVDFNLRTNATQKYDNLVAEYDALVDAMQDLKRENGVLKRKLGGSEDGSDEHPLGVFYEEELQLQQHRYEALMETMEELKRENGFLKRKVGGVDESADENLLEKSVVTSEGTATLTTYSVPGQSSADFQVFLLSAFPFLLLFLLFFAPFLYLVFGRPTRSLAIPSVSEAEEGDMQQRGHDTIGESDDSIEKDKEGSAESGVEE